MKDRSIEKETKRPPSDWSEQEATSTLVLERPWEGSLLPEPRSQAIGYGHLVKPGSKMGRLPRGHTNTAGDAPEAEQDWGGGGGHALPAPSSTSQGWPCLCDV